MPQNQLSTWWVHYILKLLVLGSWHDKCIMIYFKTSSFSKLARILVQLTLKAVPACVSKWWAHPQSLMLIDQRKLKLLVLARCSDECVMMYLKTFSFSNLPRILQSNWHPNQSKLVSWYDVATHKVWCWLIQGNSSYRKKTNVWRLPICPTTDIPNLITRFRENLVN